MSGEAVVLSSDGDKTEALVPAVGGWGGVDKLVEYLQIHFDAAVLSRIEGPDARVTTVRLDTVELRVEFEDPWGCAITATGQPAKNQLSRVVDDLRRRLE